MSILIRTASTDPWHNLALEECLFLASEPNPVLYLWQNQNTVVIGRHQNAWKECRTELLEAEGGKLARRSTGGGAVFHDLGNLNFTFIMPAALYDVPRQCDVILNALNSLNIRAERSGRNDLTINGGKFSGNAFRRSRECCIHHGTLLLCVDTNQLARYLAPSPAKLQSKGVNSVRSRVTNLCEHRPDLTLEMLIWSLERAFCDEYGPARRITEKMLDPEVLAREESRYASWEWRYGKTPAFDMAFEQRFDFGCLELQFIVKDGTVSQATVYSDFNDEAYVTALNTALRGGKLHGGDLERRVLELGGELAEPVSKWVASLRF